MPEPGPRDVLIAVKACGVIPNMNAIFSGTLWNRLPPLPASVGLDAAGVVAKVGSAVTNVAAGARVYVNPWLNCGTCVYCRAGTPLQCSAAAFQGYFGFTDQSAPLLRAYPYGGFAEYMVAACERLVMLPETVSFDAAARFGYLGTSFGALRTGGVGAGSAIAINGITGTLGAGATLHALGMGATRILGIGRNRDMLAQLKALAPARIDTLALGDAPVTEWLLHAQRRHRRRRLARLLRPRRLGKHDRGRARRAQARRRRGQYRRAHRENRNRADRLYGEIAAIPRLELVHHG